MLKTNTKKLQKSEVEIEGELAADAFENYFGRALKKIGETVKLDGFREGKIPESVLLGNISEVRILEEMANLALSEHYPKILEEEKLDAIGHPEIQITKLARKNPLGFKIKIATLPKIELPDYKDLAKKVLSQITEADKDTTVTDKELENTILDIQKSRAPKKHVTEDMKEDEIKEELPPLDDEFVKALGPFKNVEDFKEKLKINIKLEKENRNKEKTRVKIIEDIIEKTKVDLPEILVEIELDKILYRMESDIAQMGLKFEDYLKHLNKTLEDLKKEFRSDAEKKAKLALVLNEISKIEKIVADEKDVEKEVTLILEHYKEADPERARIHAENVLTNERIFQFLENQ
ncbi:hypothetical protein HZA26_02975 [Candidatus Nomurabacteria bacterium]|nr:hypothetical protein [Candidatus Nomurabacteria bacterium]